MIAGWGPAVAGLACGIAARAVLRRSDTGRVRREVNRIQACLLEFWLYVDEPLLAIRTWKDLFAANVRLLRALALPATLVTAGMAPVLYLLEGFYGAEPLAPGRPALVTVRVRSGAAVPRLSAPPSVSLDSAPVQAPGLREVSWRILPTRDISGRVTIECGPFEASKSMVAGRGPAWVSRRRSGPGAGLLVHPFETPLPGGPVEWIEIGYPPAAVSLFGATAHWSLWFAAFSFAGALLRLRARRFT